MMKTRTMGILLALALVAVGILGPAATALAAPTFTSVNPNTRLNTNAADFTLYILGSNFSEITGGLNVRLEQNGPPFDVIYASAEQVNSLLPPTITCTLNTYGQHAGTYNVVIEYYTGLGQVIPDKSTLYGVFTVSQPGLMGPTINSLTPSKVVAGGAGFDLIVAGANFAAGGPFPAVVYWNSTALTTTGMLPNPTTSLRAAVPAALIATPTTASIKVVNPAPGGGQSNIITIDVVTPAPTLTSISPTTGWAKYYQPYTVLLTGTNFLSGSKVLMNGAARSATLVGPTQLSLALTAADIATPGTISFAVQNPEPGGGISATQSLTLSADTTAPVTTISGADTAWHNAPVVLTVSVIDAGGPGVQMTQYGIGSAGVTPAWLTLSDTTITVPAPAGGSGDGAQVVSVFSTDDCNNVESPPKTVTVNICTVGPETQAFAPGSVKKGKTLKLGYRADSITPTCAIKLKIFKSNGSLAKTVNVGERPSNTKGTKSFTCNLAPGSYKYKVYATDAAGNAQTSMDGDSFKVTR
jgi:hypothetical protein